MNKEIEKLKEIREKLKLSQVTVAKELGVTKQYYNKVEKGLTALSKEKAVQLCKTYGISFDWFFGDGKQMLIQDEELNEKVHPMKYDEMVKSQDLVQLMHLVRALFNIKNERAKELRRMKSADSRMLTTARKLLYGEIAESMGKDFEEMSEEMDNYLSVL